MSKTQENNKSHRIVPYSTIVICFFIIGLCVSGAEGNWWQKGTDLLKGVSGGEKTSGLTNLEIGHGLKDALRVGTETVVSQLGQPDGFNTDPAVHIPLPESLDTVNSVLRKVGMSSMLDDLETKLNRAAEEATPKAKELFWQSIEEMTLDDVKAIYGGPDDSATRYFQGKMSPALAKEMKPIVEKSLAEVGAVKSYDNVMGQYRSMPFVPDVKANLTDHVITKGMDGIFYYLAQEEAAIRQNPAKRTTEILKKVFGAK
jgi:Protein of unknown function (DUF4197)